MTFNQKITAVATFLLVGITLAIAFTVFESPYTMKFWTALTAITIAEILFGAFWVQQISKPDAVLPVSLGVWGLNLAYLSFTIGSTLLSAVFSDNYFLLLHAVVFAAFVIAHLMFRLAEHHVEKLSEKDEPEQKIEKAKVTWR